MFDDQLPSGECDFHEFATWVPATALFAILGVPAERIAPVKPELDTLGFGASLSKDLVPAVDAATLRMMSFYGDLIKDRCDNPTSPGQPDLLDMLIAVRGEGKLDDEQLVVDLTVFSTGATVTGMLTFIMRLMIDRPEMYQRCAGDADFCRLVVEEALRHCSTSMAVRLTTEDVLYRDVLIPEHTILFFPFSVSGRDPGSFPDGKVFDPERPVDPERRNIAFGLGRHMCIGQYIARVEMQEALQLMAQRIREPKLAGDYGWRPFFGIWGMDALPISFTPG
jgi:cytochrome P450